MKTYYFGTCKRTARHYGRKTAKTLQARNESEAIQKAFDLLDPREGYAAWVRLAAK